MEQPQPFRKKKRVSDKNLSLSRKIRGYAILAKGDMPIAEIDIDLGRNRWLSLLKQSLSYPNTTKKEVILK